MNYNDKKFWNRCNYLKNKLYSFHSVFIIFVILSLTTQIVGFCNKTIPATVKSILFSIPFVKKLSNFLDSFVKCFTSRLHPSILGSFLREMTAVIIRLYWKQVKQEINHSNCSFQLCTLSHFNWTGVAGDD